MKRSVRRDIGHAHRRCKLLLGCLENLHQQGAGNGKQVGNLRVGEPIEDLARTPVCNDEIVAAKNREMLRKVRGFQARIGEQICHGDITRSGENFQYSNAYRVSQTFEQVGFYLVER